MVSCSDSNISEEEAPSVKTTVGTVQPTIQNITEYIQLNGVTVFQKKDNIRSTNTGYITSLKFKQGDYIQSGQVFCTIGTKEQQALKNIASLDTSLNKFKKSISVLANTSGIINSIGVLQGTYISEGEILANVSDPASLIVQVNVPYEYNQYISVGKNCEIILPDGKIISIQIMGVMPTVDILSQSQSYFIRLPNQKLPENLNVIIRIPYKQKNNSLCVPTSAVQTDEMQKEFWVMKITNDSIAIKTPVLIGLQNDSLTEIITNTISVNDKIILQGAYGLADSSIVINK